MKVAELFQKLSYGELSNLAIGGEGNGSIPKDEHPKIINYLNDGLLALYSRFVLKENDILIEQVGHITNYHLKPQYAESARANAKDIPYPYIKDMPDEPFKGDVIKILAVHNNAGRELPLNDRENPDSLFTPQPNILQVPHPVTGAPLNVVYQASHSTILTTGKYLNQDIDLPIFLEKALKDYIAHLVYSHMNGQDNVAKSQEYLLAFNTSCMEIDQKDLNNSVGHTSHTKLEQRGFV